MSDAPEFEPAPAKSIWPALMDASDDSRLHRLLAEAHRMMQVVRVPTLCGESFPAQDPIWVEFSRRIEAEEKLRAQIATDLRSQAQPPAALLMFPTASDEKKSQPIRKDVESAGDADLTLLNRA